MASPKTATKPDASVSDSLTAPIFDRLTSEIERADATKAVTQPVNLAVSALDKLHSFFTGQSEDDAIVLAGAIESTDTDKSTGKAHLTGAVNALRDLDALADLLRPTGSPDRATGNALVTAFENLKTADNPTNPMLTPEAIERGNALVTRWQASAPKTSGSGGQRNGPGKPKLGYTVVSKCQRAGCSVKSPSTGTDYLNSLRDACINHVKDHHPALAPIGSGTTAFDEVTRAIARVGSFSDAKANAMIPEAERGAFESAEGGGFKFSRKAA